MAGLDASVAAAAFAGFEWKERVPLLGAVVAREAEQRDVEAGA
jgi:hypothetical protein